MCVNVTVQYNLYYYFLLARVMTALVTVIYTIYRGVARGGSDDPPPFWGPLTSLRNMFFSVVGYRALTLEVQGQLDLHVSRYYSYLTSLLIIINSLVGYRLGIRPNYNFGDRLPLAWLGGIQPAGLLISDNIWVHR